jgi:mono/diheme cytochrome c family protein
MTMNKRNILKPIIAGAFGLVLLGGLFSCGKEDPNSPGNEYMPDMYRSPSLEAYNYVITTGGDTMWSARQPVAGTISRGNMPGIPVGVDYEKSAMIRNPLSDLRTKREAYAAEGKDLYGKYCIHCHGASGAGDGKVAAKLPGPPPAYTSENLKTLPEGKMFYSISNGKGMMGPHAPLLSVEERWKVVCYVQQLQGPAATSDTTAAAGVKPAAMSDTTKANQPK